MLVSKPQPGTRPLLGVAAGMAMDNLWPAVSFHTPTNMTNTSHAFAGVSGNLVLLRRLRPRGFLIPTRTREKSFSVTPNYVSELFPDTPTHLPAASFTSTSNVLVAWCVLPRYLPLAHSLSSLNACLNTTFPVRLCLIILLHRRLPHKTLSLPLLYFTPQKFCYFYSRFICFLIAHVLKLERKLQKGPEGVLDHVH